MLETAAHSLNLHEKLHAYRVSLIFWTKLDIALASAHLLAIFRGAMARFW